MAVRTKTFFIIGRSRPSRLLHQHTPALLSHTPSGFPGAAELHYPSPWRQLSPHPYIPATRHRLSTMTSPSAKIQSPSESKSERSSEPTIHSIFESTTGTWQYVVADPATSTAAIIDAVLDYDPATQKIGTTSADALLSLVRKENYTVAMILETHAHADHLTAASYLQSRLTEEQGSRPPIAIGQRIDQVQRVFGQRYGLAADKYRGVFDRFFKDNESFNIGSLTATALHLPGHTPDHMGYKIGDHVFCGDSIFHADLGTARCDFPGGSAEDLFQSGRRLLSLPDHVNLWVGHDYPPTGEREEAVPCMTVGEHKRQNKHLKLGVTEAEFVALRNDRDARLAAPRLLHPSLQINIAAGRLPQPAVIRLPLKLDGVRW
ncbi:beta-lactamase-like protein [Aspergillus pseudoustus]|uniref:Beta-lactamase-like protein n=1 Tax=Aspergillus pseudoustus TaxID=1810923 RepID=A0ABR4ILB6_9EURO